MSRALSFTACLAATFGLLVACSNETITLATVPDDTSSSEAGVQAGGKCAENTDCPAPMYCERDGGCDSAAGTCQFPPLFCPSLEDPKCGCDGVTYFNDCLRKAASTSAADDGECNHRAAVCDSNGNGCSTGQICARLGFFGDPTSCTAVEGHCWILPSTCPPADSSDGLRWDECSTDPKATHCQDTCTAIHSGQAFVRAEEQCQ